jgi:hypothetical protein
VPTVIRIDGLTVKIYLNDHRPAHVHVKAAGDEAIFYLGCPGGPITLRDNFGLSGTVLRRIERALTSHLTELCAIWKEMHADY